MWRWMQSSGSLFDLSGALRGMGYSGAGDGMNNHAMQDVHDVGPLPCGFYTIHSPYDTLRHGPFVLPLAPDDTNLMFGRGGFLIHGDKIGAPGTASQGCIILSRDVRELIWNSNDHRIEVVP